MTTFRDFAAAVHQRFLDITQTGEVFRVAIDKDDLWAMYLDSFPPGTNPIFRERTEHDCSCCRQFVKNVGGLVTIGEDGRLQSVWDVGIDGHYGVVAATMSMRVTSAAIDRVYRSREQSYGKESNIEVLEDGSALTWNHFHCRLPNRLVVPDVGVVLSQSTSTKQVLERGLTELKAEAIEAVIDLIESNSLYRGEEHLAAVKGFADLKRRFDEAEHKGRFIWANLNDRAARFRNTAIGTLVIDLSEDMPLVQAVARFESKVAPHNYKRSSAPITKGMIDKAIKTLHDLGLDGAVRRRFAVIGDVSPADVLFVDRSIKPQMKDGLTDLLMQEVKTPAVVKGQLQVGAAEFFDSILPGSEQVEVLLERSHLNNFVSLTAPVEESTGRLFKWDNDFAWCYDGDLADSEMTQKVRAAGGRTDGVFRFTHMWNYDKRNASLMDLHVFMPGNARDPDSTKYNGQGGHRGTCYGNKERVGWNHRTHIRSGGTQDVDYVQAAPAGYVPVENITFPDLRRMPEGRYICATHNWTFRPPTKGGFKAEIAFGGELFEYEYDKPLEHHEWVTVAEVTLRNGRFSIKHHLPHGAAPVEKWGVKTGEFVPVDTVMLSPNYWGDQSVGNKHHIFMLRGCRNPDSARGFFNEYLRNDLNEHRKVFEVLAGKLKCEPSDDQLSGVGFSSTRRDCVTIRVRKDDTTRTYRVQF